MSVCTTCTYRNNPDVDSYRNDLIKAMVMAMCSHRGISVKLQEVSSGSLCEMHFEMTIQKVNSGRYGVGWASSDSVTETYEGRPDLVQGVMQTNC